MAERHERVKRYSYSREVLAELESMLSPERMGTYVRAVPDRDKEQAIRLYIWNVALSSALLFVTLIRQGFPGLHRQG